MGFLRAPTRFLLLMVVLLAAPTSVRGQGSLSEVAELVARAWSEADMAALSMHMRPPVAVRLGEESHPALGLRQARAAAGRFIEQTGEGPVRVGRVRELGGTPSRGFAELWWSPGPPEPAAREPQLTVFLGFEAGDDGWKVVEIRLVG